MQGSLGGIASSLAASGSYAAKIDAWSGFEDAIVINNLGFLKNPTSQETQ